MVESSCFASSPLFDQARLQKACLAASTRLTWGPAPVLGTHICLVQNACVVILSRLRMAAAGAVFFFSFLLAPPHSPILLQMFIMACSFRVSATVTESGVPTSPCEGDWSGRTVESTWPRELNGLSSQRTLPNDDMMVPSE